MLPSLIGVIFSFLSYYFLFPVDLHLVIATTCAFYSYLYHLRIELFHSTKIITTLIRCNDPQVPKSF